ncbi:hypothetical protein PMAC_001063 [Pneumocystis sp. 'macacae']|nr:hypothetical protein PMAC_001063 [Pneumocystis sp. 'macacae']
MKAATIKLVDNIPVTPNETIDTVQFELVSTDSNNEEIEAFHLIPIVFDLYPRLKEILFLAGKL